MFLLMWPEHRTPILCLDGRGDSCVGMWPKKSDPNFPFFFWRLGLWCTQTKNTLRREFQSAWAYFSLIEQYKPNHPPVRSSSSQAALAWAKAGVTRVFWSCACTKVPLWGTHFPNGTAKWSEESFFFPFFFFSGHLAGVFARRRWPWPDTSAGSAPPATPPGGAPTARSSGSPSAGRPWRPGRGERLGQRRGALLIGLEDLSKTL